VVQFFARLHHVHHVALVAVASDRLVNGFGSADHRPEGGQRVQYHGDTGATEYRHAEHGGAAVFSDVGQQRHRNGLAEPLEGVQVVGGFGEDGVGAGFHAGMRTFDGGVHPFHRDRIGAGDDVELVIGAGVDGGLHAVGHFLGTDDFLARAVAAALGADLVLDVAAGGAELGEALDGAGNIEGGRPEAGVDVDDQRHITDVGDAAHVDQHVVQGVDAQVGQAQRAGSHTAPGKIDGPVTGTLGQQGVVGVDG